MEPRKIALDIEDVSNTARGPKIINALLCDGSELFRTKRGRLAIVMRMDIFEKQRRIHGLNTEEGMDGLQLVSFRTAAAAAA